MKKKHFLIVINHPSQFHVFKNLVKKLNADGHHCILFIQERGIVEDLAKNEGFDYRFAVSPIWREKLKGKLGIPIRGVIHMLQSIIRVFKYCLFNKVDIMMGTSISITHVGSLLRIPSFVFSDDDFYIVKDFYKLAFPFAKYLVTAEVVDVGKYQYKRIGYKGNQKVAYLHPDYFTPNPKIPAKYGLEAGEYSIIRIVSFGALHDLDHQVQSGLSKEALSQIIPILKTCGDIVINLEDGTLTEYSEYCLKIDPQDMHDLMYYARLLLTDSQSMHVEAGLLGTPSIRTNKWVDMELRLSCIDYIEREYALGKSISPKNLSKLLDKVKEYCNSEKKSEWIVKRDKFFEQNTNLTDFLYWLFTTYPMSTFKLKNNPKILDQFNG